MKTYCVSPMYQSHTRFLARATRSFGSQRRQWSLFNHTTNWSQKLESMWDKAGIPGFFSNHSDRTAIPHPNFLRPEGYVSAATKTGYQKTNIERFYRPQIYREYKHQSKEMLHNILKAVETTWTESNHGDCDLCKKKRIVNFNF